MSIREKKIIIAPSLLACDFSEIGKGLDTIANAGAEYLHLDVMDGLFVPNISFGQPLIKSIRRKSGLVFDVHLMIERPSRYIDSFADAGADIITIHAESEQDPAAVLAQIKKKGIKSAVSIKPNTPAREIFPLLPLCDMVLVMSVEPGFGGQKFMPDSLAKVRALRAEADEKGLDFDIEIDGGIDMTNIRECAEAGANIFVAGSSVFGKPDPALAIRELLNAAQG